MPHTVSLDFETASELDLTAVGAYRYAEDPSTFVRCVAFHDPLSDSIVSFEPEATTAPGFGLLLTLAKQRDVLFRAWNAAFERVIWNRLCTRRYGWPEIPLERWRCTMVEAAALALPRSLEAAARAVGSSVTKDMEGRRLMLRMASPLRNKTTGVTAFDMDLTRRTRLRQYCETDVRTEMAIKEHVPDLPAQELALYFADQRINDRGVAVDHVLARSLHARYLQTQAEAGVRMANLTSGAVTAPTQNKALLEWLNDRGVRTNSVAKLALTEMLAKPDLPAGVREVLELRQAAAKSSLAKAAGFLNAECADGRVHGMFQFNGADTGRWTGLLIQLQNLPARNPRIPASLDIAPFVGLLRHRAFDEVDTMYPVDDLAPLALRSCLIARPGTRMVWGDFSQVEARVVAWLAGEKWLLDLFASGGKVYETMASAIYGIPVEKVGKHSVERQLAKGAVLGCMFGMGAARFADTMTQSGVPLALGEAQRIVTAYRRTNARITRLWRDLGDAVVRAVATPGAIERVGRLRVLVRDGILRIVLPSRRRALAYHAPVLIDSQTPWGATVKAVECSRVTGPNKAWLRTELCGTFLTENVTQAVARDLLAEVLERLEATPGLDVVMHVHDEVVCESALPDAEATLHRVMTVVPAWAQGLPVDAEVASAERYQK